jgi:hypothetical protein
MPTKPAVKTLWLIILASFLIGLGLAGLGFALGGNLPLGIGPGGMRFQNIRTGMTYNARMQPRTVDADSLSGSISEEVSTIRVGGVGNIRIIPTDFHEVRYSVTTESSVDYRISAHGGTLEIMYVPEWTIFGMGMGWNSAPHNDEIVIEVPRDIILTRLELSTVSGTIQIQDSLRANTVVLNMVSGNIEAISLGDTFAPLEVLTLNSVSGTISIGELYTNRLELSQVSGISTIGLVDLDNFNFDVGRVSAQVTAGGNNLGNGQTRLGAGSRSADISTVSGNITLTSIEQATSEVYTPLTEPEDSDD